ncbi:fumarylacetoacetate hydrolase family protein [Amycolatopsis rhabdoformis]|uniref:Fumarylacetoacetate hydrolase family protein n=1 Tax=Amycolatopsis rhabdoformis TaxID=1448059 RepID=A0ABZ1IJ39_9PSEU|nr:fumarylacetoacetate hydrolase family protein [Amycolatopsis rhabdoformis]WSE34179.1 fumarylacetoacetate hydrolase family protein [Amycolatopsis rhabdoformis]
MTTEITTLATRLDDAARNCLPEHQLSADHDLSLAEAYQVQHALVARRLDRGETRVGVKLGFTSRAKAAQMGVSDVIIGQLTSEMHLEDGAGIWLGAYVHPRAEPEVAFRLAADLDPRRWTGNVTETVDAVAPALEIIDSRYRDFRFNLADVVADNTSAAGFVVGAWQPLPRSLDNRGVVLEVDGRVAESGSTAAILGDPLRAVTAAIRLAAAHDIPLRAGDVLLAGAGTPAVTLTASSTVTAAVSGLGRVRVRVTSAR